MSALLAAGAAPMTLPAVGTAAGPVVVELFTSQGCSSCPPADALLLELARDRADLLPLAFHVTYWDRLGWRDPFSLAEATARQRRYAASLGLSNVYTPQLVVGGRSEVVGSDRQAVLAAIALAAGDRRGAAVALTRADGRLAIDIRPANGAAAAGATIWLVGYDGQHRTSIARGENGGRSLLEANIVRSMQDLGPWSGSAVTLREAAPPGERSAVLVQAPDGRIIGAAREPSNE